MLQTEEKWTNVRIPTQLVVAIEKIVKEEKDEFGLPRYRSKSEFVVEAVRLRLEQLTAKKEIAAE